jgi:Homeodomain-like domain
VSAVRRAEAGAGHQLGIPLSTFYRWYDRYRAGGPEALEGKPSTPDRVWNRIPDEIRERIALALEVPELSPRELATHFAVGTSLGRGEHFVKGRVACRLDRRRPSSLTRPGPKTDPLPASTSVRRMQLSGAGALACCRGGPAVLT